MLIFLSSCLNFKYGVKIHEYINCLKNVVFWCGLDFFHIEVMGSSDVYSSRCGFTIRRISLHSSLRLLCLLTYVGTTACVPRLCQGKHWPQCKVRGGTSNPEWKCGTVHTKMRMKLKFRVLCAGVLLKHRLLAFKSYKHFLHYMHNSLYYLKN